MPVADAVGRAVPEAASQENFPVASRLLPRALRTDLMAVYTFARMVDDIGDDAPVQDRAALLDEVDRDLGRIYAGKPPAAPYMRRLAATIGRHAIPADPFRKLVEANRHDQVVTSYETFDDLLDYCRLSADPVGHIVLYLWDAATPRRMRLSDRVCSALQILEHLQDVREDQARGRVYLPQQDLRRFGCVDADLTASTTPTRLRGVIALETERAARMLAEGSPLVAELRGWARFAVSGYLAGGKATVAALRGGRYDVLDHKLRPRPPRLLFEWLLALAPLGRS